MLALGRLTLAARPVLGRGTDRGHLGGHPPEADVGLGQGDAGHLGRHLGQRLAHGGQRARAHRPLDVVGLVGAVALRGVLQDAAEGVRL
eukprot:3786625-Pyramimonas_sp.AAC.1